MALKHQLILQTKKNRKSIFVEWSSLNNTNQYQLLGSKKQYFYRNKMNFPFRTVGVYLGCNKLGKEIEA